MTRESGSQILAAFDRIRRESPNRPLIHLPLSGTTLAASDIRDASLHDRLRLEKAGIGRDHLIIYAGGNRPELFGVWLACLSLGTALMPVDAGTAIPELVALAERFGASEAILPANAAAAAMGDVHPFSAGLVRVSVRGARPRSDLYGGAAVLKLTSGSTGLPKATFTTETQLVEDTRHITMAMDIRPDDCQMAAIPLSHAYGIGNLVVPLFVQGTAIVLREGFVPHQFIADATTYGARVFPGTPFMFDHFKDRVSPGAWPQRLDRLISAGARLDASTVRAFHASFGVKIHSFYGTSETGGIAFDDSSAPVEDGTVGRPMPGVTIDLLPEPGASPGRGRVHVSSAAVASGYVGEASAGEGFTGGGFLTGDFGRFNDRGDLVLTGRMSSFINVAGRKVQPEEVEAVLRKAPGIIDVRIVGAPDPARGEQVVACIVVGEDAPRLMNIRQFCAARLAPYKIPRTIIKLDRIPLTERGKTDKRRLREIVDERLRQSPEAGVL